MIGKTIKNELLNEQYIKYNHKSGLTLLMCPMQGFSSTYALFTTNYGSLDTCFRLAGEDDYAEVPEGIAHFLEHKMFEDEDGDAFAKYAKTGANANAYTSFDRTAYEFLASDNVYESLEILIKMVTTPYFTEASVAKEQGIIGQEIEMYNDNPNWRVYFNLLGAMYQKSPIRIDIAGTAETIAQIDKDILYRCYNTFYNLKNMVLAVSGKFEPEKVIEICDRLLSKADDIVIERKTPDEPETVLKNYVEQSFEVAMPMFQLGFKIKPYPQNERLRLSVANDIILEAIAGEASPLYSRLYEKGLINDNFGYEGMLERECAANIFSGESENPKAVQAEIVAEIKKVLASGIDNDAFERAKKFYYGRIVNAYNDVEAVASAMATAHINNRSAYDIVNELVTINKEYVDTVLKRNFNTENMALSVVQPK